MSNLTRLRSLLVMSSLCLATVSATVALTGCASSPDPAAPDGGAAAQLDATGTYSLRSTYSLAAVPQAAAALLVELDAATDGPDDPSRYLIDRLVARVPDGRVQLVAAAVAPYLAAYVQARIDTVAPRLADGTRALADGLNRIARRFGTLEQLAIGHDGRARRHITGLTFDVGAAAPVEVALAPLGLADIAADGNVALDGERLTIGEHAAELPYAALLRAGLDRAVVGRVVPGAMSLEDALVTLVDCGRLGALVSEYVGLGAPELYARSCGAALTFAAAEIYEHIAATAGVQMVVAGSARVSDLDADGPADTIASGTWSGTIGDAPIALSAFEGTARR